MPVPLLLPASFAVGSYLGFHLFDGVRKTYEYFKCQYAEGPVETILAYQRVGVPNVRKVPIKIVRVDNPLDTAMISASSFVLGGLFISASLQLACLALKTALVGSSFMLFTLAVGYLFYHSVSSNFQKEAATTVSLQQGSDIDQLIVRQLPVRLYLHNVPFLTDQPIHCPGNELSDACQALPYI